MGRGLEILEVRRDGIWREIIAVAVELRNGLNGRSIVTGEGTVISLGNGEIEPALPAGSVLTLRTTRELRLGN